MAVCFAGAYLTAEQEEWRKVHATLEFTLGGLAVFRIIWGFVGTRHSRFSSFLRGSEAIMNNLRQLPYGWGKRHIGHSPIGALFIVGLLTLMLIASSSSCASSVLPTADWLDGIHAVATNMLLMVAGSYIAAVAFDSWRAGENLMLSMIHGSKLGSVNEAIPNAQHGAALLLVVAVLGFWGHEWQSEGAALSSPGKIAPVTEASQERDGDKP
jgi:cytochrome b